VQVFLFFKGKFLKNWLRKPSVQERFFIGKDHWKTLSRQLDMDPVGIGFEGIYQINYGLLAQVILILQHKRIN